MRGCPVRPSELWRCEIRSCSRSWSNRVVWQMGGYACVGRRL